MANGKKIDINKEIIIEKCDFILRNSYFFYQNLMNENKDVMENLKQILLSPLPLNKCYQYEELLVELSKYKIKNFRETSYRYSLEVLFHIVTMVRSNLDFNNSNIDLLRLYTKFISKGNNDYIHYENGRLISVDVNKYNEIVANDKQKKKNKIR